jgi:hypothetical protein
MPFSKDTSAPPPDRRCQAIKRDGEPCKNWALPGTSWCRAPKHGPNLKRKLNASGRFRARTELDAMTGTPEQVDALLSRDVASRRAALAAALDADHQRRTIERSRKAAQRSTGRPAAAQCPPGARLGW